MSYNKNECRTKAVAKSCYKHELGVRLYVLKVVFLPWTHISPTRIMPAQLYRRFLGTYTYLYGDVPQLTGTINKLSCEAGKDRKGRKVPWETKN
jgi:hypothetical protein